MKSKKYYHIAGLLGILIIASCSKQAGQQAGVPGFISEDSVDPAAVFSAKRDGHVVTLEWPHDFSACESIEISRNITGIARDRYWAAVLKSNVKQFKDTLPDAQAYWYWIKINLGKGKNKTIGPMRVPPDIENGGSYVNISERYPWKLHRDNSTATIAWDFPNIKYQYIKIMRGSNSRTRGNEIFATLEWSGKKIDTMRDPDSDYWYRIEARLEDGTIISQGPIKAEFISN